MLTDPIADMLTRIRNAHLALHKEVSVPRSKMKEAMATILKQEGYGIGQHGITPKKLAGITSWICGRREVPR